MKRVRHVFKGIVSGRQQGSNKYSVKLLRCNAENAKKNIGTKMRHTKKNSNTGRRMKGNERPRDEV